MATAESLTGGMLGAAITGISGSSSVYWGGIVSYSVDAKVRVLGVDSSLVENKGVVSRETAEAMASGCLALSGADIAIAVTGIAGPDGGTEAVPVGTVWIASARMVDGVPDIRSLVGRFRGNRRKIRKETVAAAFRLALTHLDRP